jgi:hypothetical protein
MARAMGIVVAQQGRCTQATENHYMISSHIAQNGLQPKTFSLMHNNRRQFISSAANTRIAEAGEL